MSDTSVKQTTSLAIAEKKPHRPGGCVGIFFQLFDWNRRFAKKKLFPKKLLPPAGAKQACNKFIGDEKRPAPKLHLIADENSGGFPSTKKNRNRCSVSSEEKHEMRAPGLVARLMGLESMPTMQRDKHKKSSVPDGGCKDRHVSCESVVDREDLNIEKGNVRPQKIQKTGQFYDRKAVSKFGAESFQIKGVLSKAKKNHHPKLASPLKSPKIPSTRSASRTSRLIDAASKILEPGLQAASRSKNALTYSSSLRCPPNNVALTMGVISPELLKRSGYNVNAAKFVGHNACKNCGNLIDNLDHTPDVEVDSFVSSFPSDLDNASSYELERSKPRATVFSFPEQVRGDGFQRTWGKPLSPEAENKLNTRTSTYPVTVRKHVSKGEQVQFPLSKQQCNPQNDESVIVVFKHRNEIRNPVFLERDRMPSSAKANDLQPRRSTSTSSVCDAKNYVALNKTLSSRSRPRVASREYNAKIDMGRSSLNKQDDSWLASKSPMRKRRTRSPNGQVESKVTTSSCTAKQIDYKSDTTSKKDIGDNARTERRSCIKSRTINQAGNSKANGKRDNGVSFWFNSQTEHIKGVTVLEAEGRKNKKCNVKESDFLLKNSTFQEIGDTTVTQSSLPITGDALGALLEQKLKELSSQDDDELTPGAQPKKSIAMILQELIAALTAEQPTSIDGHKINTRLSSRAKSKMQQTSAVFPHDVNHFSPGSVLEASFSNDSCISSSFDDNSGLCSESVDGSCEQAQLLDHDADSLDSGSKSRSKMLGKLFNQVSKVLHSMGPAGVGLAAMKVNHTKEVILNTELCLGHAFSHHLNGTRGPLMVPFLLDKIEAIATSAWSEYDVFTSLGDQGGNSLRLFLFDFIIEFLDSKYGQCCNSGFKGCVKLSSCTTAVMLLQEILDELKGWMNLCEKFNDDIIEWEITRYLDRWTSCDTEEFETGIEVERDIVQMLVDEIVKELWES